MFRFLLLLTFLFSLSNASITVQGVYFDDYEENASSYFLSYYPYQDFIDIHITATNASRILACRNYPAPVLTCASNSGLATADFLRIREQSHLIDWNVYTDQFGMTLHQTNFLYGLTGLLVGIGFYFGFIFILARR